MGEDLNILLDAIEAKQRFLIICFMLRFDFIHCPLSKIYNMSVFYANNRSDNDRIGKSITI